MNGFAKICRVVVLVALVLWLVPVLLFTRVSPSWVGVRTSALSGVLDEDLSPGWHYSVPGMHSVTMLPTTYFVLDYTSGAKGPQQTLVIRTKDNNTVEVDVSVPIRITPGQAHAVVATGNHARDADGRFRYMRLAEETATSVLREELATLDSVGFYSVDRRLVASQKALATLNQQLAPMHLEAADVLVRAVTFRPEYEKQLTQIQLNEQNKLLDAAAQKLAGVQQTLDNYQQGTSAQVSQRTQDWVKRRAELERAYQVGMLDVEDAAPGAARAKLAALTPEQLQAARAEASKSFAMDEASVTDQYLIGINNIAAETLEYKQRVSSSADAIQGRLEAEGDAMVAQVQGDYENRLNELLGTPAGRAYVAYQAAANVKFAPTLTFSSADGIPAVLRLRQFADSFMGGR